jgi:hypothetical protein
MTNHTTKRKLIRKPKPTINKVEINTDSKSEPKKRIKKRLIRVPKPEPEPKKIIRNLIRVPKQHKDITPPPPISTSDINTIQPTEDKQDESDEENIESNKGYNSEDDLEEVLVINWKCSHYQKDYLLDPITQEVFCKKSRDLLGVRYRNDDDELSLIDFN